jgi:hypothetical protein
VGVIGIVVIVALSIERCTTIVRRSTVWNVVR